MLTAMIAPEVRKVFRDQYSPFKGMIASRLADSLEPQFPAFKAMLAPELPKPFTRQYSPFKGIVASRLADVLEQQQAALHAATRALAEGVRLTYPPNIRNIEGLSLEQVDAVVMGDGIPLFGVPRSNIARSLLHARDAAARRAIIGRRWQELTDDCDVFLAQGVVPELDSDRSFARRAVRALRDGHSDAAQALAANLLDTILRKHFALDRVVLVPSNRVKTPVGYEDFIVRKYVAVAPVWSAYQRYDPQGLDGIPRRFARHASAHAVSRAQFSRRNAVQAAMLVSSLLGYLDDQRTGWQYSRGHTG